MEKLGPLKFHFVYVARYRCTIVHRVYITRVHRVHYRGKFTTASCYANVGNGGKEIGRIVQ